MNSSSLTCMTCPSPTGYVHPHGDAYCNKNRIELLAEGIDYNGGNTSSNVGMAQTTLIVP